MKILNITQQLSKTQHKARYKHFWRNYWRKLSVQEWIDLLTGKKISKHDVHSPETVLSQAVEKLKLERKINEEEASNLLGMLQSPDPDNKYMALCIMRKYKPKEFKRIKNLETT